MRLNLSKLLKERGWTRYRLAKESGISLPTIYRLARVDGKFARLESGTIDALCEALGVSPGELIVHTSNKRRGAA